MENLQNPIFSSIDTTPTSTTAGSATNDKGKQFQVLALRKRNVDDKKSHKFEIIILNLMVIVKFTELDVIIVEMIMHDILFLMEQVRCGVI